MSDTFTRVTLLGQMDGAEVFEFVDGDLVDDDLRQLFTMSLFTWRRALPDDDVPEGVSRQGWWADPEFGSRLWLLNYRKVDASAVADARLYTAEALDWMVDEQIVERIDVTTERDPSGRGVLMSLEASRPLQPDARIRYAYLWAH